MKLKSIFYFLQALGFLNMSFFKQKIKRADKKKEFPGKDWWWMEKV